MQICYACINIHKVIQLNCISCLHLKNQFLSNTKYTEIGSINFTTYMPILKNHKKSNVTQGTRRMPMY